MRPGGLFTANPPRLPSPGMPFRAWGINNHGQVVGSSMASNPEGPVTFVWTPVPTGNLTDDLVGAIDDLVAAGSLTAPDGNGIRATLTQVQRKIDEGNTRAAISQLRAFINQVRALVQSGRLSAEDGAALIAEAEALIALLS